MSGIYIPDTERPTSCYECPCNKDDGFGFFTCWVTKSECDFISLPPNCPLIPVPEHGRLIDRDAVMLDDGPYEYDEWCKWALDQYINAPTIIPADPVKEGDE